MATRSRNSKANIFNNFHLFTLFHSCPIVKVPFLVEYATLLY
ncbi:hypothetical protein COLO4_25829 [Corchorus olitorius]|uniref:Uncharacterized protein n=1 Tax=Corchorus olitorius TaxID=93759 RepID=A0A1R3HZW0_9ROSI|nr:hypothetical protein COLO4_25829 [Corchorus olitorius]